MCSHSEQNENTDPNANVVYDVIVVGAGVAGASLAISLARDGRKVLCIERTLYDSATGALVEPNRIVGELLQPGGYDKLVQLGLRDALEGIDAIPIYGYGIFLDGRAEQIDYSDSLSASAAAAAATSPSSSSSSSPPAPAPSSNAPVEGVVAGRSFHNGRFLRRLREIALTQPNLTLCQGTVTALDKAGGDHGPVIGVTYKTHSDCSIGNTTTATKTSTTTTRTETRHARAHLTVACDGCSSNLRRRARSYYTNDTGKSNEHKKSNSISSDIFSSLSSVSSSLSSSSSSQGEVSVYSTFHGLVLDMRDIPFPNHGHVVLADPTPVLFYPISSTEVRCLVDISSDFRGDVTHYMLHKVLPQIPEAFRVPFERAVRNGGSKMMPNRVMPAPADVVAGAILLGDAFNMRHPLTGGGMTVALSDIQLIRHMLRTIPSLDDSFAVATQLQQFYTMRKPLSSTINILANALYTLFCAADPALKPMRDACYDYITAGGRWTHDPMGMMGGLKPHRLLLIVHFFAVALYGCGRVIKPFPTPVRMLRAWSTFRASFNIIKPLIDAERLPPFHWIPVSAL